MFIEFSDLRRAFRCYSPCGIVKDIRARYSKNSSTVRLFLLRADVQQSIISIFFLAGIFRLPIIEKKIKIDLLLHRCPRAVVSEIVPCSFNFIFYYFIIIFYYFCSG